MDGVLVPNINGYTFSDETEFVESVVKILNNNDLALSMKTESLRISHQFTQEGFGNKMEKVYNTVIQKWKDKH